VTGERQAHDNRTTALLASSVTALDTLGAWRRCRERAAPLELMRIVDDTRRLLRAPEVVFAAREIGIAAFGYNIENRFLVSGLEAAARDLPSLELIETQAEALEIDDACATVRLADGSSISARLAVGADGRRSLCRAAAGIATQRRSYPQVALTFNLSHRRPHHHTSTEFHTERGPFTLVPLPGRRSSVVLVVEPTEVPRIGVLACADLADELERRAHSILGKVEVEPGRGAFPLAVESAQTLGASRVVLIGEAAHIVPPIGAQGLNLGLRDAATLSELAVAAHRAGDDVGELGGRYEAMRRADIGSRTLAIDLLNRSLLWDFLPLQAMRGLGLFLLERIGPLRRAAMREGVMPLASQPRLMRGETL
jgi:2-octaprenyl-6-methoxyphenol hydroxylase